MSSINMTRTRALLEMWLLGKPKLSLPNMFKPWKHVLWIKGTGLTELICLLCKPKINRVGDKLGRAYMRCMIGCWHNAKDLLGVRDAYVKLVQPKLASAWASSNKMVFNYKPSLFPQGI